MDEKQMELAERMEEAQRAAGIEQSRAVFKETHPDFDGETCVGAFGHLDCEEIIPKGRLELGRIRCVHCETRLEKFKATRR